MTARQDFRRGIGLGLAPKGNEQQWPQLVLSHKALPQHSLTSVLRFYQIEKQWRLWRPLACPPALWD